MISYDENFHIWRKKFFWCLNFFGLSSHISLQKISDQKRSLNFFWKRFSENFLRKIFLGEIQESSIQKQNIKKIIIRLKSVILIFEVRKSLLARY